MIEFTLKDGSRETLSTREQQEEVLAAIGGTFLTGSLSYADNVDVVADSGRKVSLGDVVSTREIA